MENLCVEKLQCNGYLEVVEAVGPAFTSDTKYEERNDIGVGVDDYPYIRKDDNSDPNSD